MADMLIRRYYFQVISLTNTVNYVILYRADLCKRKYSIRKYHQLVFFKYMGAKQHYLRKIHTHKYLKESPLLLDTQPVSLNLHLLTIACYQRHYG